MLREEKLANFDFIAIVQSIMKDSKDYFYVTMEIAGNGSYYPRQNIIEVNKVMGLVRQLELMENRYVVDVPILIDYNGKQIWGED